MKISYLPQRFKGVQTWVYLTAIVTLCAVSQSQADVEHVLKCDGRIVSMIWLPERHLLICGTYGENTTDSVALLADMLSPVKPSSHLFLFSLEGAKPVRIGLVGIPGDMSPTGLIQIDENRIFISSPGSRSGWRLHVETLQFEPVKYNVDENAWAVVANPQRTKGAIGLSSGTLALFNFSDLAGESITPDAQKKLGRSVIENIAFTDSDHLVGADWSRKLWSVAIAGDGMRVESSSTLSTVPNVITPVNSRGDHVLVSSVLTTQSAVLSVENLSRTETVPISRGTIGVLLPGDTVAVASGTEVSIWNFSPAAVQIAAYSLREDVTEMAAAPSKGRLFIATADGNVYSAPLPF